MTSALPSGNTARTSLARIASLTFSLILGRRGGKPLGGYMPDYAWALNRAGVRVGNNVKFRTLITVYTELQGPVRRRAPGSWTWKLRMLA